MPRPFAKNDPRINRKGRPKKGESMTDILAWAVDQNRKVADEKTGKEKPVLIRHLLADKLIGKALEGDVSALRYVYDRLDGRPVETVEMSAIRNDIPDDPDERRAMAEQIQRELGLTRASGASERVASNNPAAEKEKS